MIPTLIRNDPDAHLRRLIDDRSKNLKMINNGHRREQTRFSCVAPVVIFRETTHMPSFVLMQNYSGGGFYFETSDPLHSGDPIIVRTDDSSIINPVGSGSCKLRLAEVKWCVEIGNGNARRYGCGAQFM